MTLKDLNFVCYLIMDSFFILSFSISYLPYATMGSGSLAAVSILESKYKDNMELEEAR